MPLLPHRRPLHAPGIVVDEHELRSAPQHAADGKESPPKNPRCAIEIAADPCIAFHSHREDCWSSCAKTGRARIVVSTPILWSGTLTFEEMRPESGEFPQFPKWQVACPARSVPSVRPVV